MAKIEKISGKEERIEKSFFESGNFKLKAQK